jgi:hypothetical protein
MYENVKKRCLRPDVADLGDFQRRSLFGGSRCARAPFWRGLTNSRLGICATRAGSKIRNDGAGTGAAIFAAARQRGVESEPALSREAWRSSCQSIATRDIFTITEPRPVCARPERARSSETHRIPWSSRLIPVIACNWRSFRSKTSRCRRRGSPRANRGVR